MDEVEKKIDDVVTAIRKFQALPDVAGFLVSPDVWDYLAATIPIVRGSSISLGVLHVTRVQSLPTRTIVPVDRKGRPIEKEASSTVDGDGTNRTCAACGCSAEGNYSIERDGIFTGNEVDLCDPCGDSERPTLEELWAAIARRRAKDALR